MKTHAFLAIGFLAAATLAQAGPPFATDDPEPVEFQHWEVYLGAHYEHRSDGASGTLPHLEVNYDPSASSYEGRAAKAAACLDQC